MRPWVPAPTPQKKGHGQVWAQAVPITGTTVGPDAGSHQAKPPEEPPGTRQEPVKLWDNSPGLTLGSQQGQPGARPPECHELRATGLSCLPEGSEPWSGPRLVEWWCLSSAAPQGCPQPPSSQSPLHRPPTWAELSARLSTWTAEGTLQDMPARSGPPGPREKVDTPTAQREQRKA